MRNVFLLGSISITVSSALAHSGASIVTLSSEKPKPPRVAPGQIVYIRLHGLKTTVDATQVATTIPPPTDFNGLSVSFQQTGAAGPILLPLLHGSVASTCFEGPIVVGAGSVLCSGDDPLYDVVVQISFELKPNSPEPRSCSQPPCSIEVNDAVLQVKENGGPGMSLRIAPVVDQIHIINSCADNVTTELFGGISNYATYPCFRAIAHSDNSWVSPTNPAKPGEVVTAYAFGLGAPDVSIASVSEMPAGGLPISRPLTISYAGLLPSYSNPPEYVGLVAGNAGLYQINFRVPQVPTKLPSCGQQRPSNVTMVLQGTSSSDMASFCVQP